MGSVWPVTQSCPISVDVKPFARDAGTGMISLLRLNKVSVTLRSCASLLGTREGRPFGDTVASRIQGHGVLEDTVQLLG